jgi:O-antigen/teichoic acid export membrane protein
VNGHKASSGRADADWAPSEHGSERGGLQKRIARGLTWTLIDTWGSQLLGMVIFIVLTHLLEPDDFGLVALAGVFVALGQLFADQGLGDAVVQRRALTRLQLDTAFWVALVTGTLLTVGGFILAGPVAGLVGEPRLEPILQVLSLIFFFVALNSIQVGLLRREMRFRSLAMRKLAAIGIGGGVGIVMAFQSYGAWALVGQQIAGAAVSVALLWTVSPWRPSLRFSRQDFRSLFSFGLNVVGTDLLTFLTRNTDNLLIGVFMGPVPLGFYAVAYRILDTSQTLLINAARRLVFPSLARLQHDLDRFQRAYLRLSRTSSTLTLPGYVGLALVAPEAIVVVFGAKWAASGMAAAVLFSIGPVLTIQAFSAAAWNSLGHPEVSFRFNLISTAVNVIGFIIAVAVFGDIVAVAAAYTIRGYVLLPLNLYWLRTYTGVPIRRELSGLRNVYLATAVMAVCVFGVKLAIADQVHRPVLLATEVVVGVAAYLVGMLVFDRPLLKDVVLIAAQALPGGERVAALFGIRLHERKSAPPEAIALPAADDLEEA